MNPEATMNPQSAIRNPQSDSFLGYTGDLACDLLHDMRALLRFFQHGHCTCVGDPGIEALNLRLRPAALCNMGLLRRESIGRFDAVYRAAGALLDELQIGHCKMQNAN